jgi:hypothetical protein
MPLEIYPECEGKPRLIIPALIWLGVIIASIVIAVMLTGCAETPTNVFPLEGTCAVLPVGTTDSGISVYRFRCQP